MDTPLTMANTCPTRMVTGFNCSGLRPWGALTGAGLLAKPDRAAPVGPAGRCDDAEDRDGMEGTGRFLDSVVARAWYRLESNANPIRNATTPAIRNKNLSFLIFRTSSPECLTLGRNRFCNPFSRRIPPARCCCYLLSRMTSSLPRTVPGKDVASSTLTQPRKKRLLLTVCIS